MGNRGAEYNEPEIPKILETALIDINGDILWLDDWGYDDVSRLYSEEEVIIE